MKNIVFHIGHHKTGTTWLQKKFFSQRSCFNLINNTNEPWKDKLCNEIICSEQFDIKEHRKLLNERIIHDRLNILSAERFSGHPISGGFDMPKIAQRLKMLAPDAKILITIRKPHDFIISAYKQVVKEGYCGTLSEFLNSKYWKTSGPNKDYFLQEKVLKEYEQLFGKENLLVLHFEEFVINKELYLKKIEDFLNVDNHNDSNNFSLKVNHTFSNRRIKALKLLNRLRKNELNPFPLINLGDRFVLKASFILSCLFTKKLDNYSVENFLS